MKHPQRNGGFTLAEVAVTLVIVGIGLTLVLQGLNTSKLVARQTHNRKVARELALLTLGELEAGLYWEDLDSGDDTLAGTYAEQGYEEWRYEVVLGDEPFARTGDELDDESWDAYHDSWDAERDRQARLEDRDEDEEEDEENVEPFEKVRIQVVYPKLGDFPNELVLERWLEWDLVYGTPEDAEGTEGATEGSEAEKPD